MLKASSKPSSTPKKGDSAPKGSKKSNSTKEDAKINQAIKDKMKNHPSSINDDAKLTVTVNGQVVAKFCKQCNRYTKGSSMHFTTKHRAKAPPLKFLLQLLLPQHHWLPMMKYTKTWIPLPYFAVKYWTMIPQF